MVFIGGGAGSVLRYILMLLVPGFSFPWATALANILASLAVGFGVGFLMNEGNPLWRLLLLTGFCGGFSTFSTFSIENYNLIQSHQYGLLMLNVLFQTVTCIAAVGLGLYLAKPFASH
jgi:CrcB protein